MNPQWGPPLLTPSPGIDSTPPPVTSDHRPHGRQGPQLSLDRCKLGLGEEGVSYPLGADAHTLALVCLGQTSPAPWTAHSQGPQAIQTSEHAAPDGLQLVGGQVQLAHRGCALEGPVFDFRHLVVAQIAGREAAVR